MRLIDVSVLKEWVGNWFTKNRFYHPYAKNNNIPITELYDILEQMPTIEERKTGHWIDEESSPFYCSECGRYQYNNTLEIMQGDYKFCPYCGADMRGGE